MIKRVKKYKSFKPYKTIRTTLHVPEDFAEQCLEAARNAAHAKFLELKDKKET